MHIDKTDVLVIGGGLAGLRASIAAAESGAQVALVVKDSHCCSNGIVGYNVAFHEDPTNGDSPAHFFNDLVVGGEFLNNKNLVALMTEAAEKTAYELEALGVSFDKTEGRFDVRMAAGSSRPRTIHCGDKIGPVAMAKLLARLQELGVTIKRRTEAFRLIEDQGEIHGALCVNKTKDRLVAFSAKSVVLATGGLGYLYAFTTNPGGIVGDGIAMAFEAGATLMDMEFVHFEPFIFVYPDKLKGFAIPTTILWDGARVVNNLGEEFLPKNFDGTVRPMGKHILSQHLYFEVKEGRGSKHGGVLFDATALDSKILNNYPRFMSQCRKAGVDPTRDILEVNPAAHHTLGGVVIDQKGFTGVRGLYAAGEVSAGVHGASRLAGAAGTEVLVFGKQAGQSAATYALSDDSILLNGEKVVKICGKYLDFANNKHESGNGRQKRAYNDVKNCLWEKVGIVRNGPDLKEALNQFSRLGKETDNWKPKALSDLLWLCQIRNAILLAGLITQSALIREESRGDHYREDFPKRDDLNWLRHILMVKKGSEPFFPLGCDPEVITPL